MGKRDEIALVAMRLFSMDSEGVRMLQTGNYPQHHVVAKFCYDLADAMIDEGHKRDVERRQKKRRVAQPQEASETLRSSLGKRPSTSSL